MAEYIERAAAVKAVLRARKPENSVAQNRMIAIILRDLETTRAADVAPVIRCLDCKHWIAEGASRADNCVCLLASDAVLGEYHYTPPDGYCYKAERRKDCPPWLQEIKEAMQDG